MSHSSNSSISYQFWGGGGGGHKERKQVVHLIVSDLLHIVYIPMLVEH